MTRPPRWLIIGLLILAVLSRPAFAYENPVLRGVNPDPSVCRVGDDFYLVASSMFFYPGLPVYHSRDLIHWRLVSHALTTPEQFFQRENQGNPMIYAATLRHHEGTFYLITTDVASGWNFYVTATNAAGPWSAPVRVDKGMFDPSLFFDQDGKVYYTRRGSFDAKDIVQAEIDIATGKLRTPLRSIAKGMVSDDTEGPHLYRIGDWYYLTMGEGGSRALHMQTIGRAKGPWGPFEPCPHNPFIAQHHAWWHPVRCLGHADLVDAPDGSWWAVCLGTRHAGYDAMSAIGRETFLFPVTWSNGWPVVRAEDQHRLTVDAKTLPLHPWPQVPARDEFGSARLDLRWTMLGCPAEPWWSLSARPGWLRISGLAQPLVEAKPAAFLGRRQESHEGEMVMRMEFEPMSDHEEAGLSVFLTRDHHYDLMITRRGGARGVVLRKTVGDLVVESARMDLAPGAVRLRVRCGPERYTFEIADEDGPWRTVGQGLVKLLGTEVAGVWSGVLMGPYATGNGSPTRNPADVDWVETRFSQ